MATPRLRPASDSSLREREAAAAKRQPIPRLAPDEPADIVDFAEGEGYTTRNPLQQLGSMLDSIFTSTDPIRATGEMINPPPENIFYMESAPGEPIATEITPGQQKAMAAYLQGIHQLAPNERAAEIEQIRKLRLPEAMKQQIITSMQELDR